MVGGKSHVKLITIRDRFSEVCASHLPVSQITLGVSLSLAHGGCDVGWELLWLRGRAGGCRMLNRMTTMRNRHFM